MHSLVVGAGVSGYGACCLLNKMGEKISVSNDSVLDASSREKFEKLGVTVLDGGHKRDHLSGIDRVVMSPGLTLDHMIRVEAEKKQVPVISEIDLALSQFDGKLIAVTGTNGKSTVCQMAGHLFEKLGLDAAVCGNIGLSPSELLSSENSPEILVMELSSYQLETSQTVPASVAVFTSFSTDHLERHKSMEEYFLAKAKIFSSKSLEKAIYTSKINEYLQKSSITVSCRKLLIEEIPLVQHPVFQDKTNIFITNALTAIEAVLPFTQLSTADLSGFLDDYRVLPYRAEKIGSIAGYSVINDSKSTNVESTLACVEGYSKPLCLMLGGKLKAGDLSHMAGLSTRASEIICFGADGKKIANIFSNHPKVSCFSTLKEAMNSYNFSDLSAHLLFSPGCASFDEFRNFEDRGSFFNRKIGKYLDK